MLSLRSTITQKLLSYFFLNPQASLYVNELARNLACDKRNMVKKLSELEKDGILKSSSRGNLKLYSIDRGYPLYDEYSRIVLKTIGIETKLKEILGGFKGILAAYIYGSYARGVMQVHSDIDLLVVGDHSSVALQRKISALQKNAGREINVVNMDMKEFSRRKTGADPFIKGLLKGPKIKLI